MTKKLGRYEIIEEIGQGGFAIVYRARDIELDRLVALKELRPTLLHDTDWVRRFRREARTIARLDHPHIVSIYDVTEFEKRLFLVMRLVDGPGLDQALKTQGCFTWSETLAIINRIGAGLGYAHTKGVLHRDLKPSNILLDPERGPMLTDFGLAKLAGENSMSVTSRGGVVGTPHYIAPEVWEAAGSRRQSDIYALGCILCEMLTGEKVFKGQSPPEVMMSHFKPLSLPDAWPAGVPAGIADVLKKALAGDPADRYTTVGKLTEALNRLTETKSGFSEPDRPLKVAPPEGKHSETTVSKLKKAEVNQIPPEPVVARLEAEDARLEARVSHGPDAESQLAMSVAGPASNLEQETSEDETGRLSGKWRGLRAHLGSYVIIIAMLGFINLLTSSYPWFLWPAMGWGVGLAFHLLGISLSNMKVSGKWRGFAGHAGSYFIIISMLAFINWFTGSDYPWFVWPAMGWGAALALHLWGIASFGGESHHERRSGRRARRRAGRGMVRDRRTRHMHSSASEPGQPEFASASVQAHLAKAQTYKEQIEALIKSTSDRHTRARLHALADQVSEWTQAIEALAKRVDRFEQNPIIRQDLESVPQAIKKLEADLAVETNEATRTELERTLANRKNQLAALEHLKNMMKRAEIKIESTLSALGTIYSQILTSQSTNHVADYGRLSADVDEEVRTLQDQLEALEEVKLGDAL